MLKRISSVLLALCLALTPLLPTALAEEADPLGRYDEPVTIRIMREKVNIWFPDGESIYDNVITRFIEEKLNIRFEIVWAVEDGQYGEQINNALAINDLPDIFEVNASQLYQAYRAEQIQPLQQVYDAYASQQVKDILSYNNNLFFAKSTFDGQTYGYPRTDDFAGGTPIMSSGPGTVSYVGWYGGGGNTVIVSHGGGVRTIYMHMSRQAATVGQQVAAGTVIGYVGTTGQSTGNHLHFQVEVNGTPVNARNYVNL